MSWTRTLVTIALLGAGVGLYALGQTEAGMLVVGAAVGQLSPAAMRAAKAD